MKKYAFITLLSSNNYLNAVLTLNESLKLVNSKFPLIVAVTQNLDDVIFDTLNRNNIYYKKIPQLILKSEKSYIKKSIYNTNSKFYIFANFYEWDKLVYIDADSLFFKNADELFDYPDGSMLFIQEEKEGNTRLFVFTPFSHTEFCYYETISLNEADQLDGAILGHLWFVVKSNKDFQIPDIYSKQVNWEDINQDISNVKIFHYSQFDYNKKNIWEKEYKISLHPLEKLYKIILERALKK